MEALRVSAVDRWVITLCNQNRVAVSDFLADNGGIRLQPGAFGRILRDWEEHWINGGQEQALEEWIKRLLNWLRELPIHGSACSGDSTPQECAL
jgi:hypothetical protein